MVLIANNLLESITWSWSCWTYLLPRHGDGKIRWVRGLFKTCWLLASSCLNKLNSWMVLLPGQKVTPKVALGSWNVTLMSFIEIESPKGHQGPQKLLGSCPGHEKQSRFPTDWLPWPLQEQLLPLPLKLWKVLRNRSLSSLKPTALDSYLLNRLELETFSGRCSASLSAPWYSSLTSSEPGTRDCA